MQMRAVVLTEEKRHRDPSSWRQLARTPQTASPKPSGTQRQSLRNRSRTPGGGTSRINDLLTASETPRQVMSLNVNYQTTSQSQEEDSLKPRK